jgi:transcriptional regulator with XRE-family HTH domain
VKIAWIADPRDTASEHDIPSLLRERLRAAMRRNPRFSLRSFAKQLGIDHSTLSQVLRNRRRLSAGTLEGIGKRMGLSDEVIRAYAQGHKKKKPTSPPQDIRGVHFDLDTFQTLSIWHHYAILELIQVQGFKTDSRWIAKTLGIAVEDVNIALQRLLRLGLLEMAGRDRWVDTSGDAEFRSATLTEAARSQLNQEIHERAIDAIQCVPSEYRVHRQVVVALDSKQLSRLHTLADEFVRELRTLATESDAKDDVYQVEISLFPVTRLKKTTRGEKNG